MAEVIVLHYARRPELVNDEHLFHGRLERQDGAGTVLNTHHFLGLPFHQMMTLVSRWLRDTPEVKVALQRFDQPGMVPVQLVEQLRELLRDDPVAAIRAMDPRGHTSPPRMPVQGPVIRSGVDTLAEAFGERVYLRMQSGCVEDPLTGAFLSLAYGPKSGWRIRGEGNSYLKWLPIQVENLGGSVDDTFLETNPQAAAQKLGELMAGARWASCLVEDLLSMPANRFFLPRQWNEQQWISRRDLQQRLERFRKEREKPC